MNTIFRLVNFHQKNYFKLVETSYEMIQVAVQPLHNSEITRAQIF